MILDDDFKWDKLINICYHAGYGGDFMCNMLYMNYNPDHKFYGDKKNNKFEWTSINNINLFEDEKFLIKKINPIFNAYTSDDLEKFWYNEYKWGKGVMVNKSKKIFTILYDSDPIIFKQNYIHFLRNALYEEYRIERYIHNMHYNIPLKLNFSIHEALPGSTNFFFTIEKIEYAFLFFLLSCIKNDMYVMDDEYKKHNLKVMFENRYQIEKWGTIFDDMIPIDVGKLFFEISYEEKAENIFSNALNKKITLDRTILNEYKKNNIEQLAKTFNIENAHELTPKELLMSILKPYGNIEEWVECLKQ
jgi:hypothetical protein